MANDCSNLWDASLDTNPLNAKGYAGDTAAAYGLLAFKGFPRTRLVLTGKFPDARFMSLQSYRGRFQISVDGIFDEEIQPDPGAPDQFTIELTPARRPTMDNSIKLPNANIVSVFYRVYVPTNVLTRDDLPRVQAFDMAGNPTSCPRYVHLPEYLDFPELVAELIVSEQDEVHFHVKKLATGTNVGIPSYCWSASKIRLGDVVVITFRAPKYKEDVRYWSICSVYWPSIKTLNGLPDYNANPDEDGFVTLVYGGSPAVEAKAMSLGFNYLPDHRAPGQDILGFIYRNLLPTEEFEEGSMYQGQFLPSTIVCSEAEFLQEAMSWAL